MVATVEAESNVEAFRHAMKVVPPEHLDKPLRLTPVNGPLQN